MEGIHLHIFLIQVGMAGAFPHRDQRRQFTGTWSTELATPSGTRIHELPVSLRRYAVVADAVLPYITQVTLEGLLVPANWLGADDTDRET